MGRPRSSEPSGFDRAGRLRCGFSRRDLHSVAVICVSNFLFSDRLFRLIDFLAKHEMLLPLEPRKLIWS